MYLKSIEINGFKSFAKKGVLEFSAPISSIVGPNGSGKSNVTEAMRFVLGEQSMKSMRGKRGEDLIWNGSGSTGRSNHASVVMIFDNSKKKFDIDYDEVAIKREVFRDGSNQYYINNSQVRLKDILELLAKVHIGATGHHIISQGEADRILNANIKERRTMIEEALGLKVYQWKITESEKKLNKTQENIKQVESLRREISPHIKFLKKQVEKIEKAKEMRNDLKDLYAEYLKREEEYIKQSKKNISEQKQKPESELKRIEHELEKARTTLSESDDSDPQKDELMALEQNISNTRNEKDELSRELGRIEGMIEFEARRLEKEKEKQVVVENVSFNDVKDFSETLETKIETAQSSQTIEEMREVISTLRSLLHNFIENIQGKDSDREIDETELSNLQNKKNDISAKMNDISVRAQEFENKYNVLKQEIEKQKDSSRDLERAVFEMMAQKSELSAQVNMLRNKEDNLARLEHNLKEEIREGIILVGQDITLYENFAVSIEEVMSENRDAQEVRRKQIEKIKIKLEDVGAGGGEDVLREYDEVVERDGFLLREIEDLNETETSLRELIADLNEKLNKDFKEGITKINKQFQEFFSLMFGGGSASLNVVAQKKRQRKDTEMLLDDSAIEAAMEAEEEAEEGIEIQVSLPRKKIKSLQMLSGGERALTSIALIFAVSQVNPPPFLVLDETDAALDEANSRKYGDMLENLSKHSQLIVVTHNRETMSRAGVLYGVTMNTDAASQLLSVKFDEATVFAK